VTFDCYHTARYNTQPKLIRHIGSEQLPNIDAETLRQLCDSLKANADSLKQRGAKGELLVIEDLFNDVQRLPDGLKILHLDTNTLAVRDDEPEKGISPGLSFLWTLDRIEKFGSAERLKKSLSEFSEKQIGRIVIENSIFEFAPNENSTAEIVHSLAPGVDALLRYSLNAVNKSQDLNDALSRMLLDEVERVHGSFGLSDLARFLGRTTKLRFGLSHLAHIQESAIITVSRQSSPAASLTALCMFLGLPRDTFSTESDGERDLFPALRLPPTIEAELILNAGKWGKPLAGAVPGNLKKRILILPITRPLGPMLDRHEHATNVFAAPDLLFTFSDELSRPLLDRLCACVDTFSRHRFGARRFKLLSQLQQYQPFDGSETSLRIGLNAGVLDASNINAKLQPLLNEILYTTSAHSVSVRLYNPKTKALVVEAVADSLDIKSADKGPPIPIGQRGRTSVAAFMFLNGTPDFPFAYLKRIVQPIRREVHGHIIEKHRTFIPKEYRDRGLRTVLITRSQTRSELCFILIKGRLPFGTLNLEAPYPSAFDSDITYLSLVKSGIERLYDSIDQNIDGRWLIANAARSDGVHELWQYQEGTTLFSEEQNKILSRIFPSRSELDLNKWEKLDSLKSRIVKWVREQWTDERLQTSVLNLTNFYHLDDCLVSANFLEAAFVILRSIIQNAVKHGEPDDDRLMVDDRPWFGVRTTPCLRIQYRSAKSAPQEVIVSLGLAPIQQIPGHRIAYGMYNVGLLTRLLGGSLYVYESDADLPLTVEIHLPIPERKS
jgi:hypothetical protein